MVLSYLLFILFEAPFMNLFKLLIDVKNGFKIKKNNQIYSISNNNEGKVNQIQINVNSVSKL